MEPSAHSAPGGGGVGPPLTHPKAAGLEAVVASAVSEAFAKHGGGRGGGGNGELEKRVVAIEARLGVIEKTMVTGESLQRELGALRTEVSKVPFETIKWFVLAAGTIAAIVFGYFNVFAR